jgi:hypothetical protein
MVKPKYGSTERLGKSYISLVGSLRDCDDGVRSSWDLRAVRVLKR